MSGRRSSRRRGYDSSDSSSEDFDRSHHPRSGSKFSDSNLSDVEVAEQRIKKDQYDLEAWGMLILECQHKTKEIGLMEISYLTFRRDVYDRALKVFPTASRFWRQYLEEEIHQNDQTHVNELFKQSLSKVPNIEIWKLYISYIKSLHEGKPNSFEEILKAYEFAVEHIGWDINAGQLWSDYVKFVNTFEARTESEKSSKTTLLRRIYSRAIECPVHGVEGLWREWERLEEVNTKGNSKQIIGEFIPKFMASKAVYRERKALYDGINMGATPRPPRGNPKEERQLALWKRVLAYEKSNPQRVEAKVHSARVSLAFNQALLCLYFYPAIWFEYAMFFSDQGQATKAIDIFNRATAACPNSHLLHFAYADYLEATNPRAAEDIYKGLLERKNDAIIWVQYMRFARRSLGTEAARTVFKSSRAKNVNAPQVVVASALMEFFYNKDSKVARNLFEFGLKAHSADSSFILKYAEFLTYLNEETNLRVLFEKALSTLPSDAAKNVWNAYLEFEYTHGDLQTITKLEKRRQTTYSENESLSGLAGMIDRYKFMELLPCSEEDLAALKVPAAAARTSEAQQADATADRLAQFPKPDIKTMVALRPELASLVHPRSATVPTAHTPDPSKSRHHHDTIAKSGIPEQIARLLQQLPSAHLFTHVPLLDVDMMLALILETSAPPAAILPAALPTTAIDASAAAAASTLTPSTSAASLSGKRADGKEKGGDKKRAKKDTPATAGVAIDESSSDSEGVEKAKESADITRTGPRPPKDDLFIKRQAAKLRNVKK